MKLGDVLKKERERVKLTHDETASRMGITLDEYLHLESGESPIEEWGPKLAQLAIKLQTPTSRLISASGKSAQAALEEGECGKLIRSHRERRNLSREELAKLLGVSEAEIEDIENGASPLEKCAPLLLAFAEVIEQPIFNLFYPCGLPFTELSTYP
jgi:transcriptional regulator with XRE-family HTH domain